MRTLLFDTLIWLLVPLQTLANDGFDVVALGVNGGISDGNLTAFFISPKGDTRGVMCDAGTVLQGVKKAVQKRAFDHIVPTQNNQAHAIGTIITEHIKGYLISHAHLDHIAGLVAVSPDDVNKDIYAFPRVISDIQHSYFNWRAWPNFGSSGKAPILNKYRYVELKAQRSIAINSTAMRVTPYLLSHSGQPSTAFLIEHNKHALLCMGDTGDDEFEKGEHLARMWQALATDLEGKRLTGIIIESSYTNARPSELLFGHLTPHLVNKNLDRLAELMPADQSLQGLTVVISHIKYSLSNGENAKAIIKAQLTAENRTGVNLVIPQQGDRIAFE